MLKEYLGLVIDALLLEWTDHVSRSMCGFDSLGAAGSLVSNEALSLRGFVESEELVDLTALGRGDSPITHVVRLQLATEAAETRAEGLRQAVTTAASADSPGPSPFDILHAEQLATALKGLECKLDLSSPPLQAIASGTEGEERTSMGFAKKKDPWAGIKGFGMS